MIGFFLGIDFFGEGIGFAVYALPLQILEKSYMFDIIHRLLKVVNGIGENPLSVKPFWTWLLTLPFYRA